MAELYNSQTFSSFSVFSWLENQISDEIESRTNAYFTGRLNELKILNDFFYNTNQKIFTLIGLPLSGKSSLLNYWFYSNQDLFAYQLLDLKLGESEFAANTLAKHWQFSTEASEEIAVFLFEQVKKLALQKPLIFVIRNFEQCLHLAHSDYQFLEIVDTNTKKLLKQLAESQLPIKIILTSAHPIDLTVIDEKFVATLPECYLNHYELPSFFEQAFASKNIVQEDYQNLLQTTNGHQWILNYLLQNLNTTQIKQVANLDNNQKSIVLSDLVEKYLTEIFNNLSEGEKIVFTYLLLFQHFKNFEIDLIPEVGQNLSEIIKTLLHKKLLVQTLSQHYTISDYVAKIGLQIFANTAYYKQLKLLIAKRNIELQPDSYAAMFMLGVAYLEYGSYQESITCLRELLIKKSSLLDAYLFLAIAYRENAQVSEAIVILQNVIEKYPQSEVFLVELSKSYFANGQFKLSINTATKAIKQNPRNWSSYLILGKSLAEQGNFYDAIFAAKQALQIKSQTDLQHCLIQWQQQQEMIDEAIEEIKQGKYAGEKINFIKSNTLQLLANGCFERALEQLNALAEARKSKTTNILWIGNYLKDLYFHPAAIYLQKNFNEFTLDEILFYYLKTCKLYEKGYQEVREALKVLRG